MIIYGNGKNKIPSIHVKDLAMFVEKTIKIKPPHNYIFAIDENPRPT